MEQNAKDKLDAASKTVVEIAKSKKGKIVLIAVLLLIFFNTVYNIGTQMDGLKTKIDGVDTRLTQAEKGTHNLDAVKADIEAINKAGELFELKLNALIKAEEARLVIISQEMENQKAYLEELKNLSTREGGK